MKWQPIETAPKDENIFICCAGNKLSIWIAYDAGQKKRIWFHKGSKKKMFMEATHWMPLPEAPNKLCEHRLTDINESADFEPSARHEG